MTTRTFFHFSVFFCATLFLTGCASLSKEETSSSADLVCPTCPPCPKAAVDHASDDDRELASVVRDISYYLAMSQEERQQKQKALTAILNDIIAANDADRIRLAGLLSLRGGIQSDQRALELLTTARKNKETSENLRQFAAMMSRVLTVRVREMQKLQDLNEMERNLLQEQIAPPNRKPAD
jgi:hypothetical protein